MDVALNERNLALQWHPLSLCVFVCLVACVQFSCFFEELGVF